MKKFMFGALFLGIASAANAGSGADKSIELTDQDYIAQWDISSASQFCDVYVTKIGDSFCSISELCRAVNGQVIDNRTQFFPFFKVSQLMNCNGYLKTDGC
ncbi:hypothetical protein TI10_06510 [Photorhabdus luminescens subsp. luminescens]|uniref:LysM domain-containing protein n=1 Tax=Photorhabdus luminescens TaxID=29488 RepID=A0A1G5PY53_PHOLU|nr:hypothetical protein [Photorhabdus luminescens]KMW73875.1 hypothetical protein TI10_06510 [Photorhabdus luminescens subsp. luminescens]SCZ54318.1 hypothetical protein SAMN02982990_00558 [Photorhabdus luminescens]